MKYRVKVKNKRNGYDLTPYSWCYDNFGLPFKSWYSIRYTNVDIYYFEKEEHYTQFLLTWGDN